MSIGMLLFAFAVVGQPADQRVAALREHAAAIRSIAPDDDTLDDLEPIGRAIGDARIVLLGEAAHGDGSTMLAKTRLVKYLNIRHDFDVLVWESGFYDCEQVAAALGNGTPAREAFKLGVMSLWSDCRECMPIMEYVGASRRTDRPITLAGMSLYAMDADSLIDHVISYFRASLPSALTDERLAALESLRVIIRTAGSRPRPKAPVAVPELHRVQLLLESLLDAPTMHRHRDDAVMAMRGVLLNLIAYVEMLHRPLSQGGADDNPIGEIEGRMLLLQAKGRFPDRKLIVWGHSGHLMRNASQIEEVAPRFKTNETVSAGEHIFRDPGNETYSIAFIAYRGHSSSAWWDTPRALTAPPDGSVEALFHAAAHPYAFVDLRSLPSDHALRTRLVARPIAHVDMRADWGRVFDGFFFIDEMSPASGVE